LFFWRNDDQDSITTLKAFSNFSNDFWSAVTCHRFAGCDLSQPMTR
jgi:hypothetical protein